MLFHERGGGRGAGGKEHIDYIVVFDVMVMMLFPMSECGGRGRGGNKRSRLTTLYIGRQMESERDSTERDRLNKGTIIHGNMHTIHLRTQCSFLVLEEQRR